jgi:tRNA 2-thiouridine synthesizing protein D
MGRTLIIFLAAPPYSGQDADTALRLAEAALAKGHAVHLFASADGVHIAQAGQHPAGTPNLPAMLATLIERGLRVELCGSCLRLRGLGGDQLVTGTAPSSLKGLFDAIAASDAVLSLGA